MLSPLFELKPTFVVMPLLWNPRPFFTPETGGTYRSIASVPAESRTVFHLDEVRWKSRGVYEIGVQSDEEEGERKHGAPHYRPRLYQSSRWPQVISWSNDRLESSAMDSSRFSQEFIFSGSFGLKVLPVSRGFIRFGLTEHGVSWDF